MSARSYREMTSRGGTTRSVDSPVLSPWRLQLLPVFARPLEAPCASPAIRAGGQAASPCRRLLRGPVRGARGVFLTRPGSWHWVLGSERRAVLGRLAESVTSATPTAVTGLRTRGIAHVPGGGAGPHRTAGLSSRSLRPLTHEHPGLERTMDSAWARRGTGRCWGHRFRPAVLHGVT